MIGARSVRQLAEHISEVFGVTSADGEEIEYISPGYEHIWGRTCESLYENPTNWIDAVHEEDRERVVEAFFRKAAAGEYSEQYRIVRPDGTTLWIEDRGFAVRDGAGTVLCIAGIAADVTHFKDTQAQLMQSERLAAIGEMMTGLAHESRNSLQRSQACRGMLRHRTAPTGVREN